MLHLNGFNIEEKNMTMLKILCPQTNLPTPTGIAMDEPSFNTSTLKNNKVGCPHCGKTHNWNKEDVITFKK